MAALAQVLPFRFDAHEVRTMLIDNQPWFVASDVASVLQYRNAPDMTRNLDDDEKGTQIVRTPGGSQEMLIINESGLYSAILRSRKPEAKRFKKWVTSEVLPTIRKHGHYADSDGSMPGLLNTTIGTDGFHVLGMLIDGKVRHLPPHARRSARLRVWAQVHRAFGVASAENIPADQMDSARNFVAAYVVEGEWQARDEIKHKTGATPAESLHNSRWLLTFDHAGKTHLTPIPQDACVMSPESLLFAIGNHEIHIDSETLAAFMLAGLERLEPDHLMRIAGVALGKLAPTAAEEADRGDIAALRSFPVDVQADIEARAWRLTGQAHARIISYVAASVAVCAGHGQDVSKPAAQHRLGQITLEDAMNLTAREMTMVLGMADNIAKTAVEYAEAVKKGMQALLERGMVIGPVVNAGRAA